MNDSNECCWWLQVNRAQNLNIKLHLFAIQNKSQTQSHSTTTTTLFIFDLIDKLFIYGLFPSGIVLNICLAIYDILSRKPFYTTATALSNLASLVLYLLNYIISNSSSSSTLDSYSSPSSSQSDWSCKLHTFAFHVSTSVASWLLVYLVTDLKTSLRPTAARHFSNCLSFIPLVVLLVCSYSIDIFSIEMSKIKIK